MYLNDVAMVAADTTRSKYYLDELIKLVSEGMNRLIHFFDEHFSQLVLRKNQSQS